MVLQYNSKVRIVLQQYSKNYKYFIHFFPRNFSLLHLIISVLFSLLLLCFSICSLLSSDPNTILASLWLLFFFFWAWVTVWVNGGCGFWRGSLFVVVVVFFFVCDRCLKGLWVVVRFGVWVVAEVSCWSWISKASHDLSLISHHGSASWVWIGGLGSVDGGFETVDLLIGWVDHRQLR